MVTILYEDRTYPFLIKQSLLETFLKNQHAPEEVLQSLTVVIKRHPEHFWNILWLPDGKYFPHEMRTVVYTNWIAEDVHWEAFCDRHERLPFWLLLVLFSLHRLLFPTFRQPVRFEQLRRKQQKVILTYINRVLLHELNHLLVSKLTAEKVQQMTYDEGEELAIAFEEKYQSKLSFSVNIWH